MSVLEPDGGVGLLDRPVTDTTDHDDEDRVTHIVFPASAVTEALIMGTPCTALCGHVWVPSRDPLKYPLCQACKQIAQGMGWKVPAC